MRFKVGHWVRLKGFPQKMKVIETPEPRVECEWFDDAGLLRRDNFKEADLELVDPNDAKPSEAGSDLGSSNAPA